jgi:hypothetical protein
MGIGIVLAGSVMVVARNRLMRRQPFQPSFVVGVQPLLVIVDENGCGNVHGVDERYVLLNVALLQGDLDLRGDIEKRPSPRRLEPQLLAKRLHGLSLIAHQGDPAARTRDTT